MASPVDTIEADRALKAKHRAMWAMGNYPSVASELIAGLGAVVVEAVGVGAGDRVLDVAAGSGNVAIPAALAGASVVASDLTPELLEEGKRQAVARGAQLEWREADVEALPFPDDEFHAVVSCVGIMFAPHHQASADEMVRVCRPGGRFGLLSWTPEGFIGEMFTTMKPYAPPPPPGVQPPPLWGKEEHVKGLLGDRVMDLSARRESIRIDHFGSGAEFRDYFKANYGPTIAVYKAIADEPERVEALDDALAELGNRYDQGGGAMEWEYLLITARKSER